MNNILLKKSGISLSHGNLTDMPDALGTNSDHDARYLKLDGSNANSNIDIGTYNFTTTGIIDVTSVDGSETYQSLIGDGTGASSSFYYDDGLGYTNYAGLGTSGGGGVFTDSSGSVVRIGFGSGVDIQKAGGTCLTAYDDTNSIQIGDGTYAINTIGDFLLEGYIVDGDDNNAFDVRYRQMFDFGGIVSTGFEERKLYASDGTTEMLNWYTDGTLDAGDNDITTTGTTVSNKILVGSQASDVVTPTTSLHLVGNTTSDYAQIDTAINFDSVAKPTSGLSANVLELAGNVTAGTHYYVCSFVTPLGETEVNGQIVGPYTFDATHGQAEVTIPVSSDYRVTKRKLYRSFAGGKYSLYLVKEIDNNVDTTYTDNKADADLTGSAAWFRTNTTNNQILMDGAAAFFLGSSNQVVGKGSYSNILTATGSTNLVVGPNAGNALSSGSNNIFLGGATGTNVSSSSSNVFIGGATGYRQSGSHNIMIGTYNGYSSGSGNYNTLVGSGSGGNTSSSTFTGSGNTCLGYRSGYLTSGSNNVFLGYQAGYYETGSNKLFIDNQSRGSEATARTNSLIYGEFNATPANQFVRVNGQFFSGDATNYAEIKADGEINLHGTARVYKNRWISVSGFKEPGTSPATYIDWGINGAWEFTNGTADALTSSINLPQDMDRTVAPEFKIGFASDTNSGAVVWQLEYVYTSPNEDTSTAAQETLTTTQTISSTADGLTIATITGIDLPSATDQLLLVRIKRLGADGSDTLADDCVLLGCGLKYVSDKFGVAL